MHISLGFKLYIYPLLNSLGTNTATSYCELPLAGIYRNKTKRPDRYFYHVNHCRVQGGGGVHALPQLKILHVEREIRKRGKEEKRKEIKKNIGKYIIFYIPFSLYI
ncbi:unnamed protein product [Meganyctiphanes norvegica]|uniref:Uncharacterized protein n=1 Tax=Meganyctiphanes norvegica TaxID=48144 RepID=A0AAV2QIM0_MEGNR